MNYQRVSQSFKAGRWRRFQGQCFLNRAYFTAEIAFLAKPTPVHVDEACHAFVLASCELLVVEVSSFAVFAVVGGSPLG